jgi:exopolyphosphatase/guanosine-5'-triphosphate,3'-diphosphate pyrophosphatase
LHRAHEHDPIPTLDLSIDGNTLSLVLAKEFIDARPLLRADLIGETESMTGLGISFRPFVA